MHLLRSFLPIFLLHYKVFSVANSTCKKKRFLIEVKKYIDVTTSFWSNTRPDPFSYHPESCFTLTEGKRTIRHPVMCNITLTDPVQYSCFKSWTTFLSDYAASEMTFLASSGTVTPTVYVWETIHSFGQNITYTDCTGIPRISFESPPTRNATSTFEVTVWEEIFRRHDARWKYKDAELGRSRMPKCSFRPEDRDWYCLNLDQLNEVGPNLPNSGRYAQPPADVCALQTYCFPSVDEVILLYWPKNLASSNTCPSVQHRAFFSEAASEESMTTTPFVVTATEITFKGRDLYLRSINGENAFNYSLKHIDTMMFKEIAEDFFAYGYDIDVGIRRLDPYTMTGNWKFTYPTLYLAHRSIVQLHNWGERDNPWAGFGVRTTIRSEGVISLRSEDVSTVRLRHHSMRDEEYAKLMANGSFLPTRSRWWEYRYETVPLNFNDLQDPVAASAYYDGRMLDCWGVQSHCGTVTDGAFRPKIRLAKGVWASIFTYEPCRDNFLVDPPVALRVLRDGDRPAGPQEPALPAIPVAAPTPAGALNQDGDRPKAQPGSSVPVLINP